MLLHYLATALRNFWRFRVATLINVLCLALGLACFVTTYAVIRYLGVSDSHFEKAERTFVVAANLAAPAADLRFDAFPQTGPIVANMLRADFPDLEAVARRTPDVEEAIAFDGIATYASVSFADPELLQVFNFSYLSGSGATALASPNSAVITRQAAERLFGESEVLGRTLRIANQQDVVIAGIIENIRKPTTLGFDLLVEMGVRDAMRRARQNREPSPSNFADWWWLQGAYLTYVLLPPGFDEAGLDHRLKQFAARHVPVHEGGNTLDFSAIGAGTIPLNMINGQINAFARTNITFPGLAYTLSGLILLIACLNYANLASALASVRGREVGLRKVVGASRPKVLLQHLFEAAMIGAASLALVLVLVALFIPMIGRLGFELRYELLLDPAFSGLAVLLLSIVTLIGGIYPGIVLSGIRPIQALRANATHVGSRMIPTALVCLQFAMAGLLLVTVMVMQSQNRLLLDPGRILPRDPVVVLTSRLDTAQVDTDTLKTRLKESSAIRSVTTTGTIPMSFTVEPMVISHSADQGVPPITASIVNVGYDFASTMEMQVLAGREFDPAHGGDASVPGWDVNKPKNVFVDTALSREMGWPVADTVGKTLYLRYGPTAFPMQIIGVVEERPLHLMGMGANSSLYFLAQRTPFTSIRIDRNRMPEALEHIDAVWKELSPHVQIRRQFMDTLLEQSYDTMIILSTLFTALATFGLVIAGMGLFGMAVYMTDRRIHEIGVRKSVGATAGQVLRMLLADFSKPLVIASVLAWPFAYAVARLYLNMFVERTSLTPVPFIVGLLMTLVVAWIAVGKRTLRAAGVSPARVLRYE